jgi:primosomal protein N' (replication factor Y)
MSQSTDQLGSGVVSVAVVAPGLGVFDYDWPIRIPEEAPQALQEGDWLVVPFGKRTLLAVVLNPEKQPDERDRFKRRQALAVFPFIPSLTKPQLDFYRFVASYYRASLGSVLTMVIPSWLRTGKNLNMATESGDLKKTSPLHKLLLELSTDSEPSADADRLKNDLAEPQGTYTLTAEQRTAITAAAQSLRLIGSEKAPAKSVYVHGVTGSGKTTVYVELLKQLWQISPQAQVLYMVPEIALTPVLSTRLIQWLGLPSNNLSILHSAMTDRQRAYAWMQAVRGQTRLILGTRLSLMTPLPRLGMVIVDEEHDSSYKSQDSVRYSARDLAAYCASQQNVRLVMGSATPSLESLAQMERGRYAFVRLLKQATGAPKASLTMVDLNKERVTTAGALTETARKAVEETLDRGLRLDPRLRAVLGVHGSS